MRPQQCVLVCQGLYSARAEPLFFSLNFLFGDIAVVVHLSSLNTHNDGNGNENVTNKTFRAGSHFDISISMSRHTQTQYDVDN